MVLILTVSKFRSTGLSRIYNLSKFKTDVIKMLNSFSNLDEMLSTLSSFSVDFLEDRLQMYYIHVHILQKYEYSKMVYWRTKARWPLFVRKVQIERTHEIFQYLTQIKDKTILIESQLKFYTKAAFNFLSFLCRG